MQEKFAQQIKKGALDMLVLKLLSTEEKYGYQLMSELASYSEATLTLKEGTLYPLLYRLEESGLLTSSMHPKTQNEPARKYYAITPMGRFSLQQMYDFWLEFGHCVKSIMKEEL